MIAQVSTLMKQWKEITSLLKWHENDMDYIVKYFLYDLILYIK